MSVGYGYDGKYGPLSEEYRKDLMKQQEKIEAEAVDFWRAEKERTQPPPKPRIRLKRKTD